MSHATCRMMKDCAALANVLDVRFQGIAAVRSRPGSTGFTAPSMKSGTAWWTISEEFRLC